MFDWESGRTENLIRFFPDDTPVIDYVLDGVSVSKIYEAWDEGRNGALIDFGGGVRAITAAMVKSAGIEFLRGIRGFGEKRANKILQDINLAINEVPYDGGL